jgi:hypothetical protein
VKVWELSKVAAHYQDEAAVILMAQHEAKMYKQNEGLKKGAMNVELTLPEF